MKAGLLGAISIAILMMATTASAAIRLPVGTVGPERCSKGLVMGEKAVGRNMMACLLKQAAIFDLDAPDAAQHFATAYIYPVHPDLLARWQTNPVEALGKAGGFVPVRIENGIVDAVPTNTGTDVFAIYTLSGTLVSSNGKEERQRPVTIVIGMYKGYFTINDFSWALP